MRFSAIRMLLASALAVNGAAVPNPTEVDVSAAPINPEAVAIEVETVTFAGSKPAGELVAGAVDETEDETSALAERQIGAAAIISALGGGVMAVATGVAVNIVTDILEAVIDWTLARETFTQETTSQMWNRNPNPGKYHAAICYNKGYRVKDPQGIDGLAKVTLRLNVLHTNYDCMYMNGPNQFWTDSEGGYINLSYTYDRNHCSFDGKTGDLTCW
ncbi:hypothetical protein CTRI78_v002694 [Colletotrichum trifolii]|uniref:DUF7888 domain-containing protein n=1 Tax=Colletotrichum trifolii TaxID=5466 RepID=A0A4V6QF04_COLTR|nr:hypothetical protein CTRI78_v002694 [Colletotrichum trifolii]